MSLTTGFTTAAGVPPRAEPGSVAPSGRATASAAAFAAVAQDLADGTVSGATPQGERAASATPDAAPAHAGATAGTVNEPAAPSGNRNGSWDVLGPSLVGWYFLEQQPQQPPAQMVEGNAALAGATPAPGSGHDAAASGAAGLALPVPALSVPGAEQDSSPLFGGAQTGPAPAGTGAGSGSGAVPLPTVANPEFGVSAAAAPVPAAPSHPQIAAAAETAPSAAPSIAPAAKTPVERQQPPVPPTAVPAQTAGPAASVNPATLAGTSAAPAHAVPAPRLRGSGAAEVSLPAAGSTAAPGRTGTDTVSATATVPGTAALPAPGHEAALPGNRASGTGTTEPAVKISAPGTFVPPAAPALPGESVLPAVPALPGETASPAAPALPGHPVLPAAAAVPASPVLPGAAPVPPAAGPAAPGAIPQTGGTAGMAPVSAAAASGFAGLEVSAKDASVVQPPVAPAPMAAPVAPASPSSAPVAAPTPAAAPAQQLLNQVSQPLVRLAAAGPGEHVMTLSVNPENLGPVTVRAVISSDGVRVEMFAPTDTAREALRHILVELRRDLAGASTGPAATLTLSDQNSPGNGSGGGAAHADDRSGRTPTAASGEPANPSAAAARHETSPQRSGPTGATTALDVMA